VTRAAELWRVCRAWPSARQVTVLAPGVRAAEGEEQGQGATARWGPEAAHSTEAGRRTGAEGWSTRDEQARAREVLQARWGVRAQAGVDAAQAQGLTPGARPGVQVDGRAAIAWHRREPRRTQRQHPSSCSPDTDGEGSEPC
jgi:hypothetical protein